MSKTVFVRVLIIALVGIGLGGCVAPRGYYSGAYIYSSPPAGGAYFNYWYYPGTRVYYDIQRHVYFYPRNGGWVRTRDLPPPMKARLGHHITIHSRHERPYLDDNTHRREYPANRYSPPVKKVPEQPRYQPPRDRYDSRRNERDNRRDDRRNERRDDRRDSAPDRGTKYRDKKSSHDNGRGQSRGSDKSERYDRNRYNDRSRGNNRNDQDQQDQDAPRKY